MRSMPVRERNAAPRTRGRRLATRRSAVLGGTLAILSLAAFAPPATLATTGPIAGLDGRTWELVSPVDKNGGDLGAPGTAAAGVLQATAGGGALAFGSASSFGEAQGSLPVNQYVATRSASGWSSQNLTPPALSGTYDAGAYYAFSADLSRAVLADGWRCRDGSPPCPAEGTPLGPGGPAGYRNLYLREGSTYTPLITAANSPLLSVSAEDFRLAYGDASPDLRHVVFSTCAALIAGATEVPSAEGCDPAAQNLYQWQEGQLRLINVLPAQSTSAPGAAIAAGRRPVSADGTRVYWTYGGSLYLREGEATKLIDAGASFRAASLDGSLAFYLKAGHLYRYAAASENRTDLTPSGGALALVASSSDGGDLYYLMSSGLYRLHGGTATRIVSATTAQLPPATGIAVASDDGGRIFFNSPANLLFQDTNASPDVYEWEADGLGSCTRSSGCLGLVSDGRSIGAALLDASGSGEDVFFATETSLLPADPGDLDIYDARVGGGFPEAPPPDCIGDDCPDPVPYPEYRLPPTALLNARTNPPVVFRHKKHRRHRHPHGKRHHRRGRSGSRR
jgi:hypothetical protein